jgi:hypothetical protein
MITKNSRVKLPFTLHACGLHTFSYIEKNEEEKSDVGARVSNSNYKIDAINDVSTFRFHTAGNRV